VQSEYTYEPFGKTTATGVASTNAFKYTGCEDDGTGLYYYRARYYHPVLQRFMSEDLIGFVGGDVQVLVVHLDDDRETAGGVCECFFYSPLHRFSASPFPS
jgi:RHS repeat-associated protein